MDIAKSSLKLFLANFASAVIQFVGIVYFARELNPSAIGVFFLFEALLGILGIVTDFGLRGAVEKRISEGTAPGSILTTAILLKLIPITVIVLVILQLQPYINNYLGSSLAVYLAIALVLQEAAQLSIFVLRGELRVGETAILKLTREVTWVGAGALFLSYGLGADALIYGLLVGLSLIAIWGWFKSSVSFDRPSLEHARSLFDFSKYNIVSSIGGYFYSWMDVVIIGLFLTQADVGAYEVAWRVTLIVILLSTAIARTIFPQISMWDSEGKRTQIESTIQRTITPSLVLVIPAFFGVLVLSQEILGVVFGDEYTAAWLVLIVLMGEKIFQAIHKILGSALRGINRPDLAAYATVASVVTNLALNVVLILQFGIVGAAVATTLSFMLNTSLHAYFLSNFLTIRFPYREVSWLVLSAVGMAVVLMLIQSFIRINGLFSLSLLIFSGSIIYFLIAITNKKINERVIGTASEYIASL